MTLEKADPQLAQLLQAEQQRQATTLEMIASENHVSRAILEAMGSVLTDKYAEGYPGRRWYCGNAVADAVEQLAIDRACKLFGVEHANVQPHSGTNANFAVYLAALKPGQKILSMNLAHGGHLSHGKDVNFSGMCYKVVSYGVRQGTEMLDYDQARALALEHRPNLIIVGASAYPRTIDFAAFRSIADEVGCPVMADIAHIAGLIAGGAHPSPVPHVDFVTGTTHKTLRGPRGGFIFCTGRWAKAVDTAIFPGVQGGPMLHVIAAKAVCFQEALADSFRSYAAAIVANAKVLAEALMQHGWRLVSGGTDNHLMLIDLTSRDAELTGRVAAGWLEAAGIVANHNVIPFDARPPALASGVRLGTPALTTRGMGADQMKQVAAWVDQVLRSGGREDVLAKVRRSVEDMCRQFPMPSARRN